MYLYLNLQCCIISSQSALNLGLYFLANEDRSGIYFKNNQGVPDSRSPPVDANYNFDAIYEVSF